ncbi:MAG: hypothetical protein ACYCVN_12320 [Acidimicrobiales bacterium]
MATMYDSVTPSAIPTNAAIVAGYIDGLYAWTPSDWAKFPTAQKVTICIDPAHDARVLDVENGNPSTPAEAVTWAARQASPCIYCNRSTWPAVLAAFAAASVPPCDFWVADWTGQPHLLVGAVAVQYADPQTSGGNFDLSQTTGSWPGPAAPPPRPVTTPSGDAMQQTALTVEIANGFGWCPCPVPASKVVSVLVFDQNPADANGYPSIPTFMGVATQPGPGAPEGVLVFAGPTPGNYGAEVWSVA